MESPYIWLKDVKKEFELILENDPDAFWDELSLKIMREYNIIRVGDHEVLEMYLGGRIRNIMEVYPRCMTTLVACYYAGKRAFVLEFFWGGCSFWSEISNLCDIEIYMERDGFDPNTYLDTDIVIDGEFFSKDEMEQLYNSKDNYRRYEWKKDIQNIIFYIDELKEEKQYLIKPEWKGTYFEYARLTEIPTDMIHLWYLQDLNWWKKEYKKGEISKKEYEGQRNRMRECYDDYPVYLFWRDKLKIINHVCEQPELKSRKLPMMWVDKNKDGTYYIHGGLTYKHPTLCGIISCLAEEECKEGMERQLLVIDVDELLESPYSIDNAVFGCKITEDTIEIFDKYEGTQLFGQALKEAYYSGKCTISDKFY